MSGRRRGRGRNAKKRLQLAMREQQELEKELSMLNEAEDPKKRCEEIIAHVQENGFDPMVNLDNRFTVNQNNCKCVLM